MAQAHDIFSRVAGGLFAARFAEDSSAESRPFPRVILRSCTLFGVFGLKQLETRQNSPKGQRDNTHE